MRRDRMTFGMMIGIPMLQLILFGFAINSDPKRLPAAVLLADHGPQGRTLLAAIRNSNYFDFVQVLHDEAEAHECWREDLCSSSSTFRSISRAICCAARGRLF